MVTKRQLFFCLLTFYSGLLLRPTFFLLFISVFVISVFPSAEMSIKPFSDPLSPLQTQLGFVTLTAHGSTMGLPKLTNSLGFPLDKLSENL